MTRHASVIPRLAGAALAALLLVGCASAPPARSSAEPRVKDSAPEKLAAQRSAARGLQLEEEDMRWGVEAARARRLEADRKKKVSDTALPTGPVDLGKAKSSSP